MQALLHFRSAYGKPVGIWWWDGARNCPTSFYLPGDQNYYARAVDTVGSAPDQEHWNQIAQKIASRTPYTDSYETADVEGDPKLYLRALQKVKP